MLYMSVKQNIVKPDRRKETMKRTLKKLIIFVLTFCVAFGSLPAAMNSDEAYASSKSPKKIVLKAASAGKTTVKLKWNKVKSPGKGYAVFRDGKVIKRLSIKKTSFTDKGLKPGTKLRYQIKTYTKKKVTKWYNKKTGKWQKKKPAKKYCGKSKKVWTYVYKEKSNVVVAKTKVSKKKTSDAESKEDKESATDTKSTQYDYKLHLFNQPYSGCEVIIYLETTNPSAKDFSLYFYDSGGSEFKTTEAGPVAYYEPDGTCTLRTVLDYYKDLPECETEAVYGWHKVDGGFIKAITFEKSGTVVCKISETASGLGKTSIDAIGSFSVIDYEKAHDEWLDSIIAGCTDDSMTPYQKACAVESYLRDNTKYKKVSDKDGKYCYLAKDSGLPGFILGEYSSATSSYELENVGAKVGYPLRSMYDDYETWTDEWYSYHYKAVSLEEPKQYFYFCDTKDSNIVYEDKVQHVDLKTYHFYDAK